MDLLQVVLIAAALLSGMVTGLLFGFVVVAMPGIGTLDDRAFLRSFKAMDRVIQNNQPVFMAAWVGSVLAAIGVAVVGGIELDGADRVIAVSASALYLLGVQVPTATINIPLNNQVQDLGIDSLDETALAQARSDFEPRWNRWNAIRTALGVVATVLYLVVLLSI